MAKRPAARKTLKHPLIIETYHTRGGYRWRLSRAGRIVAESGEAYARQDGVRRAITRLQHAVHFPWKVAE